MRYLDVAYFPCSIFTLVIISAPADDDDDDDGAVLQHCLSIHGLGRRSNNNKKNKQAYRPTEGKEGEKLFVRYRVCVRVCFSGLGVSEYLPLRSFLCFKEAFRCRKLGNQSHFMAPLMFAAGQVRRPRNEGSLFDGLSRVLRVV